MYVPNESDSEEEEASEQELDLLDDTSRIPKYALFYFYKDCYCNSIRSLVHVFLKRYTCIDVGTMQDRSQRFHQFYVFVRQK